VLTNLKPPSGWGYRPAIVGLRAVAVSMVIVFHLGYAWIEGGFIGVDLFFGISGYLITATLIREYRANGKILLLKFYGRRVLRLMPALVLMVLVWTVVGLALLPDRGAVLLESLIALTYCANWTRALGASVPSYMAHTWSLAIEEQFYLIWPLSMLLLLRLRRHGAIVSIALAIVVVWAWRWHMSLSGASFMRMYNGFDTRFDSILAGGLLAFILDRPRDERRLGLPLALGGALLLATLAVTMVWDTQFLYRYGLSLTLIGSVALISGVELNPGNPLARLLSFSPFQIVGNISYSLYLWHWPVMLLSDRFLGFTGLSRSLFVIATTGILSYFTHVMVERPAIELKRRIMAAKPETMPGIEPVELARKNLLIG
jgi:peptidoglycan/LPS O-acetylase OafA/YrhL